mgnify:CR=1 FL=1
MAAAVVRPLIALTALSGCAPSDAEEGWTEVAAVRGDLVVEVTAVGTLQPVDSVEVGSDLTGEIAEVLVEANDLVQAGQVLARIEPRPFEIAVAEARSAVASARASVAQAEANLDLARREHDRTAALVERQAATRMELENAASKLRIQSAVRDSARAQLAQARSSLERAGENLEDTVIVSPIDGVVLQRSVSPGQTVVSAMSATTLFEVSTDLSRLQAEVDIDEADVAQVEPGQPTRFSVAAWPDRTFDATVARVDLSPDLTSAVVYVAELHLDNPDGALRPGMTATASIESARFEEAVLVPSAALRFEPTLDAAPSGMGPHVWTLAGDWQALPVDVLGADGQWTAVEGLPVDTLVVTGGAR